MNLIWGFTEKLQRYGTESFFRVPPLIVYMTMICLSKWKKSTLGPYFGTPAFMWTAPTFLLFSFLRERERTHVSEGQREREKENPTSGGGGRKWARGRERERERDKQGSPNAGLKLMDGDIIQNPKEKLHLLDG